VSNEPVLIWTSWESAWGWPSGVKVSTSSKVPGLTPFWKSRKVAPSSPSSASQAWVPRLPPS
jgi:hypothetical protein